jgi:5-methylcytosine-specific restriction protein A
MTRHLGGYIRTLDNAIARPPKPKTDPIYSTPEHRKWAATVIERAGHKCEYPGCNRTDQETTLYADHIKEVSDIQREGGFLFDPANGRALCGRHHTLKTNREAGLRHVGSARKPVTGIDSAASDSDIAATPTNEATELPAQAGERCDRG